MWRKETGTREKGKETWVDLFLIFLGSQTKDTAGGVGGCQSGNGASSICHLSFSLSSRYFFPPFPSFHASVLLFLASRGSAAKANKQRRLFICASGE